MAINQKNVPEEASNVKKLLMIDPVLVLLYTPFLKLCALLSSLFLIL